MTGVTPYNAKIKKTKLFSGAGRHYVPGSVTEKAHQAAAQ